MPSPPPPPPPASPCPPVSGCGGFSFVAGTGFGLGVSTPACAGEKTAFPVIVVSAPAVFFLAVSPVIVAEVWVVVCVLVTSIVLTVVTQDSEGRSVAESVLVSLPGAVLVSFLKWNFDALRASGVSVAHSTVVVTVVLVQREGWEMGAASEQEVRGTWLNCCWISGSVSRYWRTGVGTAPGPLWETVSRGRIREAPSAVAGRTIADVSLVGLHVSVSFGFQDAVALPEKFVTPK